MKTVIRDSFDVAPDTYWDAIFFNPEFQKRMYLEALASESVDVSDLKATEGGERTRNLVFTQKLDAPLAIRKLVGDTTTMEERGTFDPKAKRWRFAMIPDRMADKIQIRGEMWVEPVAGGKIDRVCALDLSVSIFGIGSMVEKFMSNATVESYAKQTRFTRAFIAEKHLT
jgi:hypothetical protein